MEPPDLFTIVAELLADVTPYPAAEFAAATRLSEDLGLSSLELIELATAIEDRLGVAVDDSAFSTVKTIGDVVEATRTLVAQGRPA